MSLKDEIRGFLSDHVSGLLQDTVQTDYDKLKDGLNILSEAVEKLSELIGNLSVPNVDEMIEKWSEEIENLIPPPPPPPPPQETAVDVYRVLEPIYLSESQTHLLQALTDNASRYADGIGVFVVRPNGIQGWTGHNLKGKGASVESFRQFILSLQEESSFSQAVRKQFSVLSHEPPKGQDALFIEDFAGYLPVVFAIFPLLIKGKVAGLLYVDRRESNWTKEDIATLQIMAWLAGLSIETLPTRLNWIKAFKSEGESVLHGFPVEPAGDQEEIPTTRLEEEVVEKVQEEVQEEVEGPAETQTEQPAVEEERAEVEEEVLSEEHEEAQRFAKLLVSEIKLYNEQNVILGRQFGDLFERLKDDIIRSWQMYKERIPEHVRTHRDYFYEAMVRILAEGNESLLGIISWPPEES